MVSKLKERLLKLKMMNKKDKAFWIFFTICLTLFLISIIVLEVRVQHRWDLYEQRVFAEMRMEENQ